MCVVPLHGFTEYPDFSFWDLNKGQECSRFADAVFQGRIDLFGEPIMEAIINFKWRLFAKRYAYFLIFGYLVYLISFLSIVSLDSDRKKRDEKDKTIWIKLLIAIVLVVGSVFWSLEVRQFIHRPYYYIRNIYNLVDVVSLIMPIAYAINSLVGDEPLKPAYIGSSVFFVYLNLVSLYFDITVYMLLA